MAVTKIYILDVWRLLSTYTGTQNPIFIWIAALGTVLMLNYMLAVVRYYSMRSSRRTGQLPPKYPALLPFLGNTIPMAWDLGGFLFRATWVSYQFMNLCYQGKLTSTRISLLGSEIYIFQDRETIEKIMKHPSLASPMSIIIVTLRFLFGMPETGLVAYRADDSGPLAKPFPGSSPNLAPEDRIGHLLHQSFNRAFNGPGLGPTTQRFRKALRSNVEAMVIFNNSKDWVQVDDFFEVFGKMTIAALTQSVYGRLLLQLHPDIVDDLWAYDDALPWLARGIPRFLMPGPYRNRDTVRSKLRDWYMHARQDFRESQVDPDGDGDPVWGSRLVRDMQQVLHDERRTHDDNAMSSHDLALLWASSFNAVSAATLAVFHIYRDLSLLARLRTELAAHFDPPSSFEQADPKLLLKLPLLSAVYAETLRLYVKVFFMASSPHDNVGLGKWRLPRGATAVVSSGISHMDKGFWNDGGGKHPLDEFWADRFLIDPADPSSGPLRSNKIRSAGNRGGDRSGKPYFSTEGLDGLWIPYGGGPSICPGRFLAKNAVFFTCALLVTEFDIEPLNDSFEIDPWSRCANMTIRFDTTIGDILSTSLYPSGDLFKSRQAIDNALVSFWLGQKNTKGMDNQHPPDFLRGKEIAAVNAKSLKEEWADKMEGEKEKKLHITMGYAEGWIGADTDASSG
ncbi:hypothetical protein B7494_g6726 [Chlorociboria aeruginascens]|nr:hypothetical protein B7494_g6726 [Chlorociboria aeruginascens]